MMGKEQTNAAAAPKSLHLEMPDAPFEPMEAPHTGGVASSDGQAEDDVFIFEEEEEVQAVLGPSISRAQTYMMSPKTPAAEKAAALAWLDGEGSFPRAADGPSKGQGTAGIYGRAVQTPAQDAERRSPICPATPDDLPSPWRASPRRFEKESKYPEQTVGPTGVLADLNFRRYITNLNMPSLPKTPFKDFSVPSLASVFGSVRDHSPLRKGPRQNRASTLDAVDGMRTQFTNSDGMTEPINASTAAHEATEARQGRQGSAEARRLSTQVHQSAMSDDQNDSLRQRRILHRATSDQSLLLRRAESTRSSLGDDSRWITVHEQVNSRRKAIMDSLQDSKFPRPSIPDMPSFSFSALRPDFLRPRARSETKQGPSLINEGFHGSSQPRGFVTSGTPAQMEVPMAAGINGLQASQKLPNDSLSHLEHALDHLTGDVIIMGGYRGSVLRSAKPPNRQLWVPIKVGLNIRKANLEIGLEPEDEENMEDSIIPSGMLSHIGPVDMGRRLLKRLRSCKNAQNGRLRVHDYGYDWRLSPHLLSRKLIGFLENLPSNAINVPEQQRGATVIAHSMGGLITRHAVNRRPELFAGVMYAGVPQHCINILGPIRNGDEVLLSSKVLTAQVNFTIRSSYVLLPDDGVCFINKETKEEYPVDFFDVEHWKEYAFSPCIAPVHPPANGGPKKGLLESLSDSLPSLPSLPLPSRKPSPAPKDANQSSAEAAAHKLSNLADNDPSTARALDPHFSHSGTTSSTIPYAQAYKYLSRTLNHTVAFRSELHHLPTLQAANRYPPFACLYATNTPTVSRARVSSREAIRCADAYDDLQFASGDGVCLAKAAQLPEGYKVAKGGKVRTERGHVGLLGDLEAIGRCLQAVRRARKAGVGMGVATEAVSKIDETERNAHGLS